MGIDIDSARFLASCKRQNVSFARCLTLGRQNLFLGDSELAMVFREANLPDADLQKILAVPYPRYCEPFFHALGATTVDSMDASNYEQATIVHDLNAPPPAELLNKYDTVIDAGTLEHVFNFPVAIANCMRMVKVGGHFLVLTPSNNYLGHGFYQFSPELFYRVFSKANGFEVQNMIAFEQGPLRKWYSVADPDEIKSRVTLTNSFPVILMVQARKLADVPIFATPPQQSDYSALWHAHAQSPGAAEKHAKHQQLKKRILDLFPRLVRAAESFSFSGLSRNFSFRNRERFQRVHKKIQ